MSFPAVTYRYDFPTVGASTALSPEWGVYVATPGNAGNGARTAAMVNVVSEATAYDGKCLRITAQNVGGAHHHGGVALNVPMTYGQFTIRVRVSDDASDVTSGVVLLWPVSEDWPKDGEIDWWETFGHRTTRTPTQTYVHRLNPAAVPPYTGADDVTAIAVEHAGVDQSEWHEIVCTWLPDKLAMSIDGGAEVVLTTDPDLIPDWPMTLRLQLDAWSNTPPTVPVTMDVDYVELRAWVPDQLDHVDARVELAFGATGSPLGWTWTDVSSRLEAQPVTIRRGRPEEGGSLQPASVSLELENADGHLMPGNPSSPFWPNVVRGTPLRITVDGAEPALLLTGATNCNASTPSAAAFQFGGDLDVRLRLLPDQWAGGLQWANGSRVFLGDLQRLISRWSAPSNKAWALHLFGAGWPAAEWSSAGSISSAQGPTALVAALRPIWLGFTWDVDSGAGAGTQTWWRWDGAGPPPVDVTTWDLVATQAVAGTAGTFAAAVAPLVVGGLTGFGGFRGRIYRAEVRNGINGTLVAAPDFSAQVPGVTSFTDSTGKVWTLNGGATISTRRPRFVGTIDEITPTWPHGDNNAAGPAPSDLSVRISASDLVRRLGQGAKPLRSSLARHVTSARYASNITAYWPCEDAQGAVLLASGTPGVGPVALTGKITAGSDSSLPASAALPSIEANEAVRFVASIPAGGPAGAWAVEWLCNVAALPADPTATQLLVVLSSGTARQWRVTLNSTLLAAEIVNNDGAVVAGASVGVPDLSGEWMLWRLDATESAGTITWGVTGTILSAGSGVDLDGAFSGTLGAVAGVDTSTTAPPDGMSFGHIIVHDGALPVGWLAGADTAWVGESAAHRIWRLCAEEGIPIEVVGEPSTYSTLRGDLALSDAMGPQGRAKLVDLLADAAAVDLGALAPRRAAPGFVYRTRRQIETQAVPALQLDARRNHITVPLTPRLDDQRLRNDVTVAATAGSSARVADAASVALEGLYQEEVRLNGVGGVPIQSSILLAVPGLQVAVDSQNLQQASWRLTLGTWPGLRYPAVTIDLGVAPELVAAVHRLDIGDRVTLTGLPAQHPADTIELLVEGIAERITLSNWVVTLTCSPGGPWLVGVLDA